MNNILVYWLINHCSPNHHQGSLQRRNFLRLASTGCIILVCTISKLMGEDKRDLFLNEAWKCPGAITIMLQRATRGRCDIEAFSDWFLQGVFYILALQHTIVILELHNMYRFFFSFTITKQMVFEKRKVRWVMEFLVLVTKLR